VPAHNNHRDEETGLVGPAAAAKEEETLAHMIRLPKTTAGATFVSNTETRTIGI
jgi:hypothetical protein